METRYDDSKAKTNYPQVVSTISYLTVLGWLIAFLINKPSNVLPSFHIRQSLGIHLLFMASGVVFANPVLGWIVGILGFVLGFLLWIIGIVSAIKGDDKPVPIFGNYFQEWFASVH